MPLHRKFAVRTRAPRSRVRLDDLAQRQLVARRRNVTTFRDCDLLPLRPRWNREARVA